MTTTVRPYLSWCLVVRNCASTLERCLQSVRERTPDAEIVILDTLSDDAGIDVRVDREGALSKCPAGADPHLHVKRTLEAAGFSVVFVRIAQETWFFTATPAPTPCVWLRVRDDAASGVASIDLRIQATRDRVREALGANASDANLGRTTQEIAQRDADVWQEYAGPRGDWTREQPWVDDMAAPRNAALALATGEVVGWIDADDTLPGAAEAQRLLTLNGRWRTGPKGVEVASSDGAKGDGGEPLPPTLADILRTVFSPPHSVDQVECDYLYRWEPPGVAVTWQTRERFVRNDGRYRWVSEGHEFLAPVDPTRRPRIAQIPLLFLHHKEHSAEDQSYSVRRHFAVLSKKWERGERCGRDALYLANFAAFLCPEREHEFLLGALDVAFLGWERCRANVAMGSWCSRSGLYQQALEHFAAAQVACPELPDPFWALGLAAMQAEDWMRAAGAFRACLERAHGQTGSEMPPRVHLLTCRMRLCEALWKIAEMQVRGGAQEAALAVLADAERTAESLSGFPALLGADALEVECFIRAARQKRRSQRAALDLHAHWDWLVHCDETLKAGRVLDVVPHDLLDHPLVVAIGRWKRKLDVHVDDRDAYVKFYNSDRVNDADPTPERWLCQSGGWLPRTAATIAWLKEHKPDATVIEFGPYDGVNVIPILRELPLARVVAVEAQERCAARLEDRAKRLVPDGAARLTVLRGMFGVDDVAGMLERNGLPAKYDAVLLFEVIEHVPSVEDAYSSLSDYCAPNGRVFLSTPWGAYDNGAPADMEKRDPRGHVRACTLAEVADDMAEAALVTEHGVNHAQPNAAGVGDTMYVRARPADPSAEGLYPVAFYVPSALWDWNATRLHATGQGASESTIVFLAERLAEMRCHPAVFGPVPGEEIINGVGYWQREKVRHLVNAPEVRLVVSRAPYAWSDLLARDLPNRQQADALWLQDAMYPGFQPEYLEHYKRIVCVSDWHKRVMHERHGIPLRQMDVIYNWVMPAAYVSEPAPQRIPHRMVYASSPDRGLMHLLRMWPQVLSMWPDATLEIFYGWEGCQKLAASNPGWAYSYRKMRQEFEKLKYQKGVHDRGRVNHAVLAAEMRQADVWPYPSWDFEETCCANAIQARAAGCVPVTVPVAALVETAASRLTRYVEDGKDREARFIEALKAAALESESSRREMSADAIRDFGLDAMMPLWRSTLDL